MTYNVHYIVNGFERVLRVVAMNANCARDDVERRYPNARVTWVFAGPSR